MRLALSACLTVVVALATSAALAGPEGTPIARAIDFHGGELFTSTTTRFEVCSKSGCSTVSVAMNGGLFRYDVTGPVSSGTRRVVATNDSVAVWLDGQPRPVAGRGEAQRLRDWAMQRVYFNFLPFRLEDPSVRAVSLGAEPWEGRLLDKVKVTFEAGSSTDAEDEYLLWFDPESARLELFAYSYTVNDGGLRFRRLFNHRRVGGLLFYDQENWGVEGAGLSVDDVSPRFVRERMRRVSTIQLRNVGVEPWRAN